MWECGELSDIPAMAPLEGRGGGGSSAARAVLGCALQHQQRLTCHHNAQEVHDMHYNDIGCQQYMKTQQGPIGGYTGWRNRLDSRDVQVAGPVRMGWEVGWPYSTGATWKGPERLPFARFVMDRG
ncbi:hypothetical protein BDN71DRAFT_1434150 [Pleurotus eryngii]|uniref:Uncharacterized protein n=1 Tax=Pleurotus eryngii TaxID=5323 RepID=A0A9P5ZR29_PLEER|nr:hypothetical protein BDN71DRAFT_1434150 [Pleurotus eryngii]